MTKHWLTTALFAGCAALTGCGDGFSESLQPAGIYEGTLTLTGVATPDDLEAVVTGDGKIMVLNKTQLRLVTGQIQVSNTAFSGTTMNYYTATPTPGTIVDGAGVTQGSLQGTVLGGARPGNFDLAYDALLYEQPSSLNRIANPYVLSGGGKTINLTVSETGAIGGSSNFGCTYGGSIKVIDPTRNLYQVASFTQTCTSASPPFTSSGLAILKIGTGTTPVNELDLFVEGDGQTFGAYYPFKTPS